MIKLLLVDDEAIIRRGIRSSIEWDQYGIEIAGEAANGAEALERARLLKPHIVLTDIRMPLLDGLDLSKQLKQELPDSRIIILSGYEDFAYAKEALSLGVHEYLLKPVGAEELIAALCRVREEIEQDEAAKRSRISLDLMLNENYPLIKADFINRVLKGSISNSALFHEKAEQLKLKLSGDRYAVMAIGIDDFAMMTMDLPGAKQELLRFSVMNIAEELLLSRTSGLVCYSEFDHLIGIISGNRLTPDFIENVCKEIQLGVKTYLKLSVSIGIGSVSDSPTSLGASYAEAYFALRLKLYRGKDSLIHYRQSDAASGSQPVLYPSDEEKAIVNCLKTLDAKGLQTAVDHIFDRFSTTQADAPKVKGICGRLILISASGIEEMGIDVSRIIGPDFNPYQEMEKLDTLKDLHGWMSGLFRRLIELVQENRNLKFKGIISTALRYIEENFEKEMNLASVAAAVFVTPNYLSRIFKEEMGVNFVEWLNRYRIEKAKTLLMQPGAKTYSVAEKVGYRDYKYFSQMFKRFVGCSPKEFKEMKAQQQSLPF